MFSLDYLIQLFARPHYQLCYNTAEGKYRLFTFFFFLQDKTNKLVCSYVSAHAYVYVAAVFSCGLCFCFCENQT